MASSAPLQSVSLYLNHARTVLTNTDNLLEGGFWCGWFALTALDLKQSITERTNLNSLPDGATKAGAIWSANQKVLAAGFSTISGGSMVLTWLHGLQLFPLGKLFPFVSSFGYVGSCISALLKAGSAVQDIQGGTIAFFQAATLAERGHVALFQIQKMLQLALYVSIAAWGALGSVHSLVGGATLFKIMDTFFYYAVVVFFMYVAAFCTLPSALPEKPISELR